MKIYSFHIERGICLFSVKENSVMSLLTVEGGSILMAKEILMPKLSSTMEVGTLLQWFKEEGDPVEVGEPLVEIVTDKINIEVESYEDGILLKKYYDDDSEIPITAVIGYIGEETESVPDVPPALDG